MQTYLVQQVTEIIESRANIKISVKGVDLRPLARIVLEDVLILDLRNDTLLSADELQTSIFGISIKQNNYKLYGARLVNPYLRLMVDSSDVLNLTALIHKAFPPDPLDTAQGNFKLSIGRIGLENARFYFGKAVHPDCPYGVNFKDMLMEKLNIDARNFSFSGDTVAMDINALSFVEKSGWTVDNLRAIFGISKQGMTFRKLRVQSGDSHLDLSRLFMFYDGYHQLADFVSKVTIDAAFDQSTVNSDFVGYLVPTLRGYGLRLGLAGEVKGRVNELRGRGLRISYGDSTCVNANLHLTGLPDIHQTLFDIDFNELRTTSADLRTLTKPTGGALLSLPSLVDTLGVVNYQGKFVGYLNNFVAYGTVLTQVGRLNLDAAITPGPRGGFRYKGQLAALDVDVGKVLGNQLLGAVTLDANVAGSVDRHKRVTAKTGINISSLVVNDYDYSGIKIDGDLTNRTYIGTVNLNDPNCKLNFLGKFDFADSLPVFDFSMFVPRIDLVALKLNRVDSLSVASFLLTSKIEGNSLDNIRGEIKLVNSAYRNQRGDFKLSEVRLVADNLSSSKVVSLNSEFAEGELRGRYNYSSVFRYLNSLISNYLPSIAKTQQQLNRPAKTKNVQPDKSLEYNDYLVKLRIKKSKKITDVLYPKLQLAENTSIYGILNPDKQSLTFRMMVPEVKLGGNSVKSLNVTGQTRDSLLAINLSSPNIMLGGTSIKNLHIDLGAHNNLIDLDLNWDNRYTPVNKGQFFARLNVDQYRDSTRLALLDILPSTIVINDSIWRIAEAQIAMDTLAIGISGFAAHNHSQSLLLDGAISRRPDDTLSLTLNHLNIASLNLYLERLGYRVNGIVTGVAQVNDLYQHPNLLADIKIDNMHLNSQAVGDITFQSRWFNEQKRLGVNLTNCRNDTTTLQAKGFVYTQRKMLDLMVDINQLKLCHLEPILKESVSNIDGCVRGKIKVDGSFAKPQLNGTVDVDKAALMVNFLNTKYSASSPITLSNSDIIFKNFEITDVFNNKAMLNGSISTEYFKNFNLNLNLSTKNFQCMNTTEWHNPSFYASAYGTGIVVLKGPPNKLDVNIFVKTDAKTTIYLPLGNRGMVDENNFITFVSSNPEDIVIDESVDPDLVTQSPKSELKLNMEIQVTPEAEAQIIIDKKMNDIIKANGRGNLKIEIVPSQHVFKMLGNYEIEKGDYLFTLKSLLNKKLKIESGSSITWNGDPLDANTNITATYRVKTSLKPILGENYTARIPVDCQILLTQKLMSPNIEFNITLPNGNSDEKAALATALNTQEKINTQFLGLLGINSFISDASVNAASSENANLGTMGLYNTVSELLSNQLSNLLSNDKLDFGINYRPGIEEELTSDQVELALSTQIFDDRLLLNGSAFNNNKNNASAPIAGNFNAEFKLNKSGKFRAKAFARYNDDFLNTITTTENEYTTGVGFMYREEFNTFKEFGYKMLHIFSSEPQKTYVFENDDDTTIVDVPQNKVGKVPKSGADSDLEKADKNQQKNGAEGSIFGDAKSGNPTESETEAENEKKKTVDNKIKSQETGLNKGVDLDKVELDFRPE